MRNELSAVDLDVLRRALVERPENLGSEAEAAAYFRGFIAGSRRRGEESERLERLQDLAHRIAAEQTVTSRGRFVGYETFLSHAYEALLSFVRNRSLVFTDEAHERRLAAKNIRWRMKEAWREESQERRTSGRNAGKQRLPVPEGLLGIEPDLPGPTALLEARGGCPAEEDDLWREIRRRIAAHHDGDERLGEIVWMRSQGHTFREVGEHFGVSEARACQIVSSEMEWLESEILPLLSAAPPPKGQRRVKFSKAS